jgi:hypothetical protein
MRRIALIGVLAVLAACAPTDDTGETSSFDPQPNQSGAPLNDDAVGPDETPVEIEEGED